MKRLLVIVLVAMLAAGACFVSAGFAYDEAQDEKSETGIISALDTVETTETETVVSPTTGLPTTNVYKPVFVQIDNSTAARPQSGIQFADVVYESGIEVDDADTRLSAVFNDVIYKDGAPERLVVGPVRSSRYYHQWLQKEWDAVYVHQGGPPKTGNPESDIWGKSGEHIKQRITAAGKASHAELFFKNDRGDSIENFAMTDVIADSLVYDYEPTPRKSFNFSATEETYEGLPEVETVKLSFSANPGWTEYRYDADKDKFIRYMSDNVITDKETGEPVEIQNVVVQYVATNVMDDDSPRRKLDLTGEGPAEFYVHGKFIKGTWERPTYDDPTVYKLENGEEVAFAPGNTWIALHPNNKSVVTVFSDGTEDDVTNPQD